MSGVRKLWDAILNTPHVSNAVERLAEVWVDVGGGCGGEARLGEDGAVAVEDEAVDGEFLSTLPGRTDGESAAYSGCLFDHAQGGKAVEHILKVAYVIKHIRIFGGDAGDRREPLPRQHSGTAVHRSPDHAASEMPDHRYGFNFADVDGELHSGRTIQVARQRQIAEINVREDRLLRNALSAQIGQPSVGTTDHEVPDPAVRRFGRAPAVW